MKELASYLDREALKGALPTATKARLSKVHRAVEKRSRAPSNALLIRVDERWGTRRKLVRLAPNGEWEGDDHHFSMMEKCFPTVSHSSCTYASTQMDCRHRLYQTEAANHQLALNRSNKMATDVRYCLFMPQM